MPLPTVQPNVDIENLINLDVGDLTAMPVKLWSKRPLVYPMSAAELAVEFPASYDVFRATPSSGGDENNNLMGGTQVPCPFLMCGICVQVTPGVESFGLPVGVVDTSAAGMGGPSTPAYGGTIAAGDPAGVQQGSFEYNTAGILACVEFLLAYRLRFLLQCKYELFDISLADVGCIDASGNFTGTGISNAAVSGRIQQANARYAALGLPQRALPQNILPGQPAVLPQAPMAQSKLGGLSMQGGLAGYYLCPAPILLAPCCNINMTFTLNSTVHWDRLKAELGTSGVTAQTGYAPEWTDGTITGFARPGAANQVRMGFGNLDIGMTLMGYNMTPKACKDYFMLPMSAGLGAMYNNIPGIKP